MAEGLVSDVPSLSWGISRQSRGSGCGVRSIGVSSRSVMSVDEALRETVGRRRRKTSKTADGEVGEAGVEQQAGMVWRAVAMTALLERAFAHATFGAHAVRGQREAVRNCRAVR